MSWTVADALTEASLRLRDKNNTLISSANLLKLMNQGCKDFSSRTRSIQGKATITLTGSGPGLTFQPEYQASPASWLPNQYCTTLALQQVMFNLDSSGTTANERWWPLNLDQGLDDIYDRRIGGGIYYQSQFPTNAGLVAWTVNPTVSAPNLVTTANVKNLWLFPALPSGTYTSRLYVEYSRTHTDLAQLAQSTAVFEFPEVYHDAPILYCEWKGLPRDGRYSEAIGRAKAEYFELVAQALRAFDFIDSSGTSMEAGLPGGGGRRF